MRLANKSYFYLFYHFCSNFSAIHITAEQPKHDTLAGDDRTFFHHKTSAFMGKASREAETDEEIHHDDQQATQELYKAERSIFEYD